MQYVRLILFLIIGELATATIILSKYQVKPKRETSGLLYAEEFTHGDLFELTQRELGKRTEASSPLSSKSKPQPQLSSISLNSVLQDHGRTKLIGVESPPLSSNSPPSSRGSSPIRGPPKLSSQRSVPDFRKSSSDDEPSGRKKSTGSQILSPEQGPRKLSSQKDSLLAHGSQAGQGPYTVPSLRDSASSTQAVFRTFTLQQSRASVPTHNTPAHVSASAQPKQRSKVIKTGQIIVNKLGRSCERTGKAILSNLTALKPSRSRVSRPTSATVPPMNKGSKSKSSTNQAGMGAVTAIPPPSSSLGAETAPSWQEMGAIEKGKPKATPIIRSNTPDESHAVGRASDWKTMIRSNSDTFGPGSSHIRRPWAKVTRLQRRPIAIPRSFPGSSDLAPFTLSHPSRASPEMNHPASPPTTASSGRSAIASSVFAQLAQGPAIVGAGLRTTIQAPSDASLESPDISRHTSAGSIGPYDMPSRDQEQRLNGGTDFGPQSLKSKIRAKMDIFNAFAKDQPIEVARMMNSGAGHAMLGASSAAAAVGNVPGAAALGATGASFAYLAGNERLIPKIEQWQRAKGRIH